MKSCTMCLHGLGPDWLSSSCVKQSMEAMVDMRLTGSQHHNFLLSNTNAYVVTVRGMGPTIDGNPYSPLLGTGDVTGGINL